MLHDGVLPRAARCRGVDARARSRARSASSPRPRRAPGAGELELVFRPSPEAHDGRYANNAWLQELPDPVTKVTWDNPLLVRPATARRAGLDDEDVVTLEVARPRRSSCRSCDRARAGRRHARAHLGYGRTTAGRVGTGVGFDAYALRTAAAPDFATGVDAQAAGRRYCSRQTQEHGAWKAAPIIREATLAEYRRSPTLRRARPRRPLVLAVDRARRTTTEPQWGMTIDLNACTGCNACVGRLPEREQHPGRRQGPGARGREMHWLRIDRYFTRRRPTSPEWSFQPVPCMQCENAPCEQVCPVAATVHDDEGLNEMVYNRCIGTRYCSNNCPYKVRRFNFFNYTKDTPRDPQAGAATPT